MAILTVSQMNRYLASKLKEDHRLQRFMMRGEVSNFASPRSGHFYFSLKDETSVIKAVMYRNMASRLAFLPRDGMHVIVSASLSVYEQGGIYQLNVTDMQPEGVGAAALALEQRKDKLRNAGLFEQSAKRPLPYLPKVIGVVTSDTGAALQDILQILRRRCPIVQVRVFPSLVQGTEATASICRAMLAAEQNGCDVIILGRGGGSAEDLQVFNTEEVAYAVYNCHVPVISAVGHETDLTIVDAVADQRAPTPSAAAELAVPDVQHLHDKIDMAGRDLQRAYAQRLQQEEHRLEQLTAALQLYSPVQQLRIQEEQCTRLTERLTHHMRMYLEHQLSAYQNLHQQLLQLDPLQILQRGYAAVYHQNQIVSSAQNLQPGETIQVRMQDGVVVANVEEINEV